MGGILANAKGNADSSNPDSTVVERWEYYDILGVDRTVTIDKLRLQRKKLALRYHPDKNQDDIHTAQQKMQQINRAFEVLSDPMKKKLYDRYGVDALGYYENKTITEGIWNLIFLLGNPKFVSFTGICCCITFSVLMIAPIFIGLKLDNKLEWNWFFVLFPLFYVEFICLSIISIIIILNYKLSEEEEVQGAGGPTNQPSSEESENLHSHSDSFLQEEPKKKIKAKDILQSCKFPFLIVLLMSFELLICFKLEQIIDFNWWIVFLPMLLLQLIYVLTTTLPNIYHQQYKLRQLPEDEIIIVEFYCKLKYIGFILRRTYSDFLIFLFDILLILNLQNYSSPLPSDENGTNSNVFSWWIVVSPLFIWFFIRLILSVIESCFHSKLRRPDPIIQEELQERLSEEDKKKLEEPPTLGAQLILICCTCTCVSALSFVIIMIISWANNHFSSSLTMLSPIILFTALLCCVCVCCAFPLYAYYTISTVKGEDGPPSPHPPERTE